MSVTYKCPTCGELFFVADIDAKDGVICTRCEFYNSLNWSVDQTETPQHPPVPAPEPNVDGTYCYLCGTRNHEYVTLLDEKVCMKCFLQT